MIVRKFLISILIASLTVVTLSSTVREDSIDATPLNEIGSALHLPKVAMICIEISKEVDVSWPVINTALNWNQNGLNLFTTAAYQQNCNGIVLINENDTNKWYGSTEFLGRNLVNIQLSSQAPVNLRTTVVCHELGHVLGLPHSIDSSCMNPNQPNIAPIKEDLITVSKKTWNSVVASHSIQGHN